VDYGDEDNNRGDSFGSLQILGSLPPACFVKQLAVARSASPGLHGSGCPSLEFVTPDSCFAPVIGHAHVMRTRGGGNVEAHQTCGEFNEYESGELVAIRIPSKKLQGHVNQTVLGTCALTWVVGHFLKNYTCLPSGRNLYDADFGDTYGQQTVLVGDCQLLSDME
jgi:hypothetical protein